MPAGVVRWMQHNESILATTHGPESLNERPDPKVAASLPQIGTIARIQRVCLFRHSPIEETGFSDLEDPTVRSRREFEVHVACHATMNWVEAGFVQGVRFGILDQNESLRIDGVGSNSSQRLRSLAASGAASECVIFGTKAGAIRHVSRVALKMSGINLSRSE